MPNAIIYPMFAMVLLTYIVLLITAGYRIKLVKSRQVSLGYYRTFQGDVKLPPKFAQLANNFNNLTQMPILFYTIGAVILATKVTDPLCLMLAWAFVALRVGHSVIHTTYNNVNHRFGIFVLSNLVLMILWINTLLQLA